MKDGDGGRTAGPSVVVCCLAKTHYFYLLIVPLNRFDRLLVCLAIQQESRESESSDELPKENVVRDGESTFPKPGRISASPHVEGTPSIEIICKPR